MTSDGLMVDPDVLRERVREKYREVADKPDAEFHFHTGRRLAARCGYDSGAVDALPVLRAGGLLQFADIATGRRVPDEATRDIDLWTA